MTTKSTGHCGPPVITKANAKAHYNLTDQDLEVLCAEGPEDGEDTKYIVWAVLQLSAACKADLHFDEVLTSNQAIEKYKPAVTPRRLRRLEVVARHVNPIHGGLLNYYRVSDVERIDFAHDPDHGQDIRKFFTVSKRKPIASRGIQKK